LPFLHSLFCRQGADNRLRFLAINLTIYFCFLLINSVIDIKLLSLIILTITSYILAMTTLRRLKDAKLKSNWLAISVISYVFIGLTIIFIGNSAINWLIFIPATLSALLLTYPSKEQKHYILGYSGPIDLSQYKSTHSHQQNHRVEPVFSNNPASLSQPSTFNSNDHVQTHTLNSSTSNPRNNGIIQEPSNDLGEIIRIKLVTHSKILLISFFVFILIIIVTAIVKNTYTTQQKTILNNTRILNKQETTTIKLEHIAPLSMPDNFTLYLSQYNGLIIHWQANEPSSDQHWSITSAQGDDSCKNIQFNKGETFRILSVNVENNIDHYASFSPLDTQPLLQAIAFRGSFSLCDFTFSLKGSQAALNKNNRYAEFIEY